MYMVLHLSQYGTWCPASHLELDSHSYPMDLFQFLFKRYVWLLIPIKKEKKIENNGHRRV